VWCGCGEVLTTLQPEERAAQVHDRRDGPRRVQGRRRAAARVRARARAPVHVHAQHGRLWLARRRGRRPPRHALRRERADPGRAGQAVQDRPARDRGGAQGHVPHDREPARHAERDPARRGPDDQGAPRQVRARQPQLLGPAPVVVRVRRVPDVRARDGRVGARACSSRLWVCSSCADDLRSSTCRC
jgi:hypothetical protein